MDETLANQPNKLGMTPQYFLTTPTSCFPAKLTVLLLMEALDNDWYGLAIEAVD